MGKILRYENESLVTKVVLKNESLGLELRCSDVVDLDLNINIKKIEVRNLKAQPRQVRLFLSHDFFLYGNDIGGTAYFDPRSCSIIQYKMHRYFLISCWAHDQWGVNHFACGKRVTSGSLVTVKEIENGELSGEAAAWGSPHATISIWLELAAKGTTTAIGLRQARPIPKLPNSIWKSITPPRKHSSTVRRNTGKHGYRKTRSNSKVCPNL